MCGTSKFCIVKYVPPFGAYIVADDRFICGVGDVLVGGIISMELLTSVDDVGFSCLIISSTLSATVPIRFTRFAFV